MFPAFVGPPTPPGHTSNHPVWQQGTTRQYTWLLLLLLFCFQSTSDDQLGLYIINTQFEHAGEYRCTALTVDDSVTASAYLTVQGQFIYFCVQVYRSNGQLAPYRCSCHYCHSSSALFANSCQPRFLFFTYCFYSMFYLSLFFSHFLNFKSITFFLISFAFGFFSFFLFLLFYIACATDIGQAYSPVAFLHFFRSRMKSNPFYFFFFISVLTFS